MSFTVWARSVDERQPSVRGRYDIYPDAEKEASRLAGASGAEGVMSVWVENRHGGVLWSAGEKAEVVADERKPTDG